MENKKDDKSWMDNYKPSGSFWDGKDLNGREVEVPSVEELIDSLDMDKLKDPNWGKGFMNRSPGFKDEE